METMIENKKLLIKSEVKFGTHYVISLKEKGKVIHNLFNNNISKVKI